MRAYYANHRLEYREREQRRRGTDPSQEPVRRDVFWLTAEFSRGRIGFDEYNRRVREMYVQLDGRFAEKKPGAGGDNGLSGGGKGRRRVREKGL